MNIITDQKMPNQRMELYWAQTSLQVALIVLAFPREIERDYMRLSDFFIIEAIDLHLQSILHNFLSFIPKYKVIRIQSIHKFFQ